MYINQKISSTIILFTEAGKKKSSPNSALVCPVVMVKLDTKGLVSLIAGVRGPGSHKMRMSRYKSVQAKLALEHKRQFGSLVCLGTVLLNACPQGCFHEPKKQMDKFRPAFIITTLVLFLR